MELSKDASPALWREAIRCGDYQSPTSGLAGGFLQGNLVIVPNSFADAFEGFCRANPKPCPLLARSSTPGNPSMPSLGLNIDIRTDLPRYRCWRNGALEAETPSLKDYWEPEDVAFVLGCSFSFDEALVAAGIELRHLTQNTNIPMYRTSIPCFEVGPFKGNMVVSMRPMLPEDAVVATRISGDYIEAHGSPVHSGNPLAIGIADLEQPDFGDPVSLKPNEVPIFWACGVTPQVVLENAKLPRAFTHAPGHMLITDITHEDFHEIGKASRQP